MDSILDSVKEALDLPSDYDVFDNTIMVHINSVFSDLEQLGVGPAAGFQITNETQTWDAFLGDDPRLNNIRTYVQLRVRLLFDPPTSSFAITAMERQIDRFEFRISVTREGDQWIDPNPMIEEV